MVYIKYSGREGIDPQPPLIIYINPLPNLLIIFEKGVKWLTDTFKIPLFKRRSLKVK